MAGIFNTDKITNYTAKIGNKIILVPAPGYWLLVPGSWLLVLGSWFIWYLVLFLLISK